MNDCDGVRIDLGGHVLGGLDPEEAAAVDAHLRTCGPCRRERRDLERLPALLAVAAESSPPAPADLRARVLHRGRRASRRAPALAAAALAVAAALTGALVVTLVDAPPSPDIAVAMGEADRGPTGEAELRDVDAGVQLDLVLAGIRPADQGYYHAWLERDGQRASAGTFVGTADGEVAAQLLCGGRLEDYDRVTVTWHASDGGGEVVAARADLLG